MTSSAPEEGAVSELPPADEVNDFYDVVRLQPDHPVLGPRHDLSIPLHRDGTASQTQPLDELLNAQGGLDLHHFSVDRDFHGAGRWRSARRVSMRTGSPPPQRASRERPTWLQALGVLGLLLGWGCASGEQPAAPARPSIDTSLDFEPAPALSAEDAGATLPPPVEQLREIVEQRADENAPLLVATQVATTVYARPARTAERLGYLRLGARVARAQQPVSGRGCSGFWYPVRPLGYVCTEEATLDVNSALARATERRPNLKKPLPYDYGFVRATAPQYLRIPSHAEQLKSEFKLEEHLKWYDEHRIEVQRVILGANDVPLGPDGTAQIGRLLGTEERLSTQLTPNEWYGGKPHDGQVPFWLQEGRQIPNVSEFKVPEYALFADRVRRKTGLSFVDSFIVEDAGVRRGFAVTVDMRLVPTTKVKPDRGSPFHGVKLGAHLTLPFGFVIGSSAHAWQLVRGVDEARPSGSIPHRSLVPLSGSARYKAGRRFYQTRRDKTSWLLADDIAVVAPPQELPEAATRGEKWIDVSLLQQTLVLYEGKRPVYATLISSGQDRLGDPETQKATPRGVFRIQSKHIAAAMDSDENSTVSGGTKKKSSGAGLSAEARATIARLKAAVAAGKSLDGDDKRRWRNIKKGRHPEYGVTRRRGASGFELRDVPWIQYFDSGFALHGAYWHDVFGIPRSHGCINLAPIDARYVFHWTEPAVPDNWHGINVSSRLGAGTTVAIRE